MIRHEDVDTQQLHSVPVKHSLEPHRQPASVLPLQGSLLPETQTRLGLREDLSKQTAVFCLSCLLPLAPVFPPTQGMAPTRSADELRSSTQILKKKKSWLICRFHLGTDTFCVVDSAWAVNGLIVSPRRVTLRGVGDSLKDCSPSEPA